MLHVVDQRELRPAREYPSGAAAALVGLLSLGFALSPSCGPRASVPGAPATTPTAPIPVAADAGIGEPAADAGVAQERELGLVAGQIVAPGGEVEGTLVSLAGSGVWPARQVRAAADGVFRFEQVPSGVYGVNARRGSRVAEPREGFWLDAGGRVFLALRLEPGARLTGRVVSSLGGAPVADAELRLSVDSLALAPRSTRTDADGRFRIEGLLRRRQRLSVRAPGFVPVVAREVRPGRELSLRLVPAAQVSGVVYDSLDQPVAGARVELLATGHARGQSVLQAPSSQVDAFSFGANLGMTSGPVPPIPATAAATADPGEPWPSSGGPSALTDAQGRFRILGVAPGASVLLASHESYAPGVSAPLRLRPGQRLEDQTLVLPQGSLIRGRVVDSRDFPAAGVAILLRTEREPLPRMTSSTSDGSFEFAHVLGAASLTATAPGLPERRQRLDAPAEGELVVTLRLEQAFIELEGRVLDEAGFPLAGVELRCRSLRYQAPSSQLARSGEDGGFRFRGLPAPPWSIDVRAPGRVAREIELDEPPAAGLELRLEAAGELRLSLRSSFDDTPLPAARVWVTRGEGRFEGQREATPGAYRVPGLPAGPLSLEVEAPGFLPLHRELELVARPGSALALDLGVLRLAPGGRLEGDVVDAHGEPVVGAQIELNGQPVTGGLSDAEGHFLLTGITPDTYHVSAMHVQAGSGQRPGSVTVYAEQTSPGVHIVLSGVLPSLDEGPPSLRSGVAVSLRTVSGRVEITDVVAGSTAARAGLRVGDELLAVDGQQVSLAGEARSRLRGPVGEGAALSIRRGGRVRRLVVERERYSSP